MRNRASCSSQEEHVLKLAGVSNRRGARLLLLARGACIETKSGKRRQSRRRKLLLARGACIETECNNFAYPNLCSCSSQEEHVLKRYLPPPDLACCRCSSQEEHVLKPTPAQFLRRSSRLLLARGACIETQLKNKTGVVNQVAPRKRSMY